MGLLRLFLALTVLDWHYRYSNWQVFPFSFSAVCCFFIISGFYMSFVLNEKYGTSQDGLLRFYANRALRLLPINVVLLVIAAITGATTVHDSAMWLANQALIFPNVVWQNIMLRPGANDLVFGQMYTVGLEMMFYAVAPWIVTRSWRFVLSVAVLAGCVHFGLGLYLPPRPWQYEFFPGILIFFLLGALSYQLLLVVRKLRYPRWLGFLAIPLFLCYCAWVHDVSMINFTNDPQVDGLYILTAMLIPFLFEASKSIRLDRYIGDLSYPVYAVQYLVGSAMVGIPGTGSLAQNRIVLAAVMLAAVALVLAVDYPIERLRNRIATSKRELLTRPGSLRPRQSLRSVPGRSDRG